MGLVSKSSLLPKYWGTISKSDCNCFGNNFFVRISISEAVFTLSDCNKLNGGLGYEERFIYKWFGRIGIKDKLNELWSSAGKNQADDDEEEEKK